MIEKNIIVTTGAIVSYQKGVSTCIGHLSDALDDALAELQASDEPEAKIVVRIVRHDKVYTDEQSANLRAGRKP